MTAPPNSGKICGTNGIMRCSDTQLANNHWTSIATCYSDEGEQKWKSHPANCIDQCAPYNGSGYSCTHGHNQCKNGAKQQSIWISGAGGYPVNKSSKTKIPGTTCFEFCATRSTDPTKFEGTVGVAANYEDWGYESSPLILWDTNNNASVFQQHCESELTEDSCGSWTSRADRYYLLAGYRTDATKSSEGNCP
jgi:hypothetical protein